MKKALVLLSVLSAVMFWGNALSIYAKATVAQVLIAKAWGKSLEEGKPYRPWGWADTWPVARIKSEYLEKDLYVLSGSHGSSLAFGPGHLDGTQLPGQGASVVGGHRDTHFKFLQKIKLGDTLQVQDIYGQWFGYRVIGARVDDIREGYLGINDRGDFLTLVTCYPFDSLETGGPLRYVVTAEPVTI